MTRRCCVRYLGSGHANLTSVRDCRLARPFAGEPRQVRLVTDTCLVLAGEQRIGLVQDEGVGAALPPGQVGDGQFGAVYPGVDMLPAVFGEGPLEGAPACTTCGRCWPCPATTSPLWIWPPEGQAYTHGPSARPSTSRPARPTAADSPPWPAS